MENTDSKEKNKSRKAWISEKGDKDESSLIDKCYNINHSNITPSFLSYFYALM